MAWKGSLSFAQIQNGPAGGKLYEFFSFPFIFSLSVYSVREGGRSSPLTAPARAVAGSSVGATAVTPGQQRWSAPGQEADTSSSRPVKVYAQAEDVELRSETGSLGAEICKTSRALCQRPLIFINSIRSALGKTQSFYPDGLVVLERKKQNKTWCKKDDQSRKEKTRLNETFNRKVK